MISAGVAVDVSPDVTLMADWRRIFYSGVGAIGNDDNGDGLRDDVDRCPDEPEDFDGFQDEDGCPDNDNDQDGILDPVDQCPFDPETVNGYLDEDGCPDTAPTRVVVEKQRIRITEKIFFEYNKADIKPISFELLDEVIQAIQDHPVGDGPYAATP